MKYIVWIFITKNWMWQRCLLIIFACQWIVSHGTRCVLCAVSFPSIDLDLECFVALAVVDDINYPEWGSIPKIYEWIKSILAGKLCRAAPTGGNRGEPGGTGGRFRGAWPPLLHSGAPRRIANGCHPWESGQKWNSRAVKKSSERISAGISARMNQGNGSAITPLYVH